MVSVKLAVKAPQWAVMMAVPRPLVVIQQKFLPVEVFTLFSTAATFSLLLSQVTVVSAPSSASNSARTEEEYTVPTLLMLSFSSVRSVSVVVFFSTRLVTCGCAATPETVTLPETKFTFVIVVSVSQFINSYISFCTSLTEYSPFWAESVTVNLRFSSTPSSV